MKTNYKHLSWVGLIAGSILLLSSFLNHTANSSSGSFPYQKSGLTKRQAAAHLLSRFTYGATPAELDEAEKIGLEKWFQNQLSANLADDSLNQLLTKYDALKLSNEEVVKTYPKPGQVLRMAVKDGAVNKDSVKTDRKEYRSVLDSYMQQNGLKPEQELFRQFINQKILRAAYSNNQLQEVMTSFWFNHFNVSISKNDCAQFIPAYERDVIRPNALGKFSDLLLATAKSPAMLYYLDNFSSSTAQNNKTTRPANMGKRQMLQHLEMDSASKQSQVLKKLQAAKKVQGLNENYAREVMELHTLGVDGGYTQQDVTQAAKVLTGWAVYPMGEYGNMVKQRLDNASSSQLEKRGFVHEGDFLFSANRHDNTEKTVLGKHFGPDGGFQEGVELLELLAHHKSTAKFISRKLAVRFVSDNPSQQLVDQMASTFLEKNGDIKKVLLTMVSSPEFWSASSLREKTKSPFELAISAVRSLHADITQPYQLYNWINKMGEKMYYYQAPTGFPDKGQYWINTGALLNRMNFGLALASGRIQGIKINLSALNDNHEPESAQAALTTYSKLIMPERDLTATIKRLSPMLNDPELIKKVDDASAKMSTSKPVDPTMEKPYNINKSMLAQVVGVIIGSPEYQRR